MQHQKPQVDIGEYQYGFSDKEDYFLQEQARSRSRDKVLEISKMKGEPEWMLEFRLKAYDHFVKRPMPNWGGDLSGIDFDNIFYYIRPSEKQGKTWDEVPEYIKDTFERLGIPEAERKFLAGVGAQYESEVIYHSLREDLQQAASSSWTWMPACASTRIWSSSISARSSRRMTTSSPP